jgi:Fur family ferric uptake transcriptional regulator
MSSMSVTAREILDAFESKGLRNTRPRRAIAEKLAELARQGDDFATDDLWRALQREDGRLGRATVFRAVDTLLDQGLLDRVEFADGVRRYRVCGGAAHHHHLTCTQCHRVVEVEVCLPPETLSAVASSADFALEGHSIELFGRCRTCRRLDPQSA